MVEKCYKLDVPWKRCLDENICCYKTCAYFPTLIVNSHINRLSMPFALMQLHFITDSGSLTGITRLLSSLEDAVWWSFKRILPSYLFLFSLCVHSTSCRGFSVSVFPLQGTSIHLLFASVLFDETQWEKPHAFYPAHFLDKEGKFVKRDAFMPFSAGLWSQSLLMSSNLSDNALPPKPAS